MQKTYKVNITTLSYVHIGKNNLSVIDYFLDKNLFYIINWYKLINSEHFEKLKDYIDKEYHSNSEDITWLKTFFISNILKLQQEKIIKYTILHSLDYRAALNNLQKIKFFIRYIDIKNDKENVFIPGSSLKGALLSIFRNDYFFNSYNLIVRDFYVEKGGDNVSKIIKINRFYVTDTNKKMKKSTLVYLEVLNKNTQLTGEIMFKKAPNEIKRFYKKAFFNLISKHKKFLSLNKNILGKINISSKTGIVLPIGFGFGRYGKTRLMEEDKTPLGLVKLEFTKNK